MTEQDPARTHATLTAALAAFQAQLPKINKGNTADVQTKTGRNYSYKYADLSDVSAAVLPLLAGEGLAWTCTPELAERGMILRGQLRHTSGEQIDGVWPLPAGNDAQALGGAMTYGRRYLLCALTGVAADEDDDGARSATATAEAERDRRRETAQREQDQAAEARRRRQDQAAEQPRPPDTERREQDRAAEQVSTSDADAVQDIAHAIDTAEPAGMTGVWRQLGQSVAAGKLTRHDEQALRARWESRRREQLKPAEPAGAPA